MAGRRIANLTEVKRAAALATDNNIKNSQLARLPTELLESVLGYVLVQEEPIELAPMKCKDDEKRWWSATTGDPGHGDYSGGSEYHNQRYETNIKPRLKVLLVCRRFNSHGSKLMFGQPFRFTSEVGWIIFQAFLSRIGATKRDMLRNVTICHPGIMGPTLATLPYVANLTNHPSHESLNKLVLASPLAVRKMTIRTAAHGANTNVYSAIRTLQTMPQLLKLRLVLTSTIQRVDFSALIRHPITTTPWARKLSMLDISILSLADMEAHRGPSLHELTPSMFSNFPYDYTGPRRPPTLHRDCSDVGIQSEYGQNGFQQALDFFRHAKDLGLKIEEDWYDNHYTYPLDPTEARLGIAWCTNMTICRFLRNRTGSGHAPCERLWPAGTINHSLVVAKINWLFRSGALPANQGYSGRAFDAGKISVKEDAKWRDGGDERQRVAEEQGAARRGIAHEELRAELAKAKRECKKGQVVVLGTDGRVVVGQPISSLDYATATSISQ